MAKFVCQKISEVLSGQLNVDYELLFIHCVRLCNVSLAFVDYQTWLNDYLVRDLLRLNTRLGAFCTKLRVAANANRLNAA